MLTWIVAHSDTLCNFLLPLLIGLSAAQQRHALNVVAALLVCPAKHKTLAALTRLLRVPHADEYALADFFRRSHWSAVAVRQAITRCVLRTVVDLQPRLGRRLLFLSLDDALCPKDAATHCLQAVDWFYDHVLPRRQQGRNTKASRYVSLHLELGPLQFALTWRLYLRRRQVQALNRARRTQGLPRLTYQRLIDLALDMLTEIAPALPPPARVYVLFDNAYDSYRLERFLRAHGWHWICSTRSNRRVSRYPLCEWWSHLDHQRCVPVTLRSIRRSCTYLTRRVEGRLPRYPDPVVALISKRARRDYLPAYFLCSDCTLSSRTLLKYYTHRWQAEVDNWFLKQCFGLADYRLQSYDAILRWHTLVFAAYTFVQWLRLRPLVHNPQAKLPLLGEVLREQQAWHARQTVCHIAALARQGQSDAQILAALCPT